MSNDRIASIQAWLAASGKERAEAVEEASRRLLDHYFRRWPEIVPVELHRLAWSLRAEVFRSEHASGDAFLMPTRGGFRILADSDRPVGRYRTAVAHELVHTLFYSDPDDGEPRRLLPRSRREEHFCFDVARRILAPYQHLELIGILKEPNPAVVFEKLTRVLLLSRPLAARVMLADHVLAKGFAARWVERPSGWRHVSGSAAATPSLSQKERARLRDVARIHLEFGSTQPNGLGLLSVREARSDGTFVVVWVR